MKFVITLFLIGWAFVLSAQDSLVMVTKNFKFKDGVYLSHNDFKSNTPTYIWEKVKVDMFVNPQRFSIKMNEMSLREKESLSPIDLDQIWGLTVGGVPYVQLRDRVSKNGLREFAGLELRGKICYFSFPEEVNRKIKMPVYNPVTREPYQVAYVQRKVEVKQERMMDFKTGEVVAFTVDNFKSWIEDDKKLLKIINELSLEKAKEKLFKSLLIYVDRNTIKIEE